MEAPPSVRKSRLVLGVTTDLIDHIDHCAELCRVGRSKWVDHVLSGRQAVPRPTPYEITAQTALAALLGRHRQCGREGRPGLNGDALQAALSIQRAIIAPRKGDLAVLAPASAQALAPASAQPSAAAIDRPGREHLSLSLDERDLAWLMAQVERLGGVEDVPGLAAGRPSWQAVARARLARYQARPEAIAGRISEEQALEIKASLDGPIEQAGEMLIRTAKGLVDVEYLVWHKAPPDDPRGKEWAQRANGELVFRSKK